MIKAIKPKEAVQILKDHGFAITEARLDMGLRQRVFPFGDAVEMPGGEGSYTIYTSLLDRWILERSVADE